MCVQECSNRTIPILGLCLTVHRDLTVAELSIKGFTVRPVVGQTNALRSTTAGNMHSAVSTNESCKTKQLATQVRRLFPALQLWLE